MFALLFLCPEWIALFRMLSFKGDSSLSFSFSDGSCSKDLEGNSLLFPTFFPGKILGGVYSFMKCLPWLYLSISYSESLCFPAILLLLMPRLLYSLAAGNQLEEVFLNQVPLRLLMISWDFSSGTLFSPTITHFRKSQSCKLSNCDSAGWLLQKVKDEFGSSSLEFCMSSLGMSEEWWGSGLMEMVLLARAVLTRVLVLAVRECLRGRGAQWAGAGVWGELMRIWWIFWDLW